jgi:hypothetical protein
LAPISLRNLHVTTRIEGGRRQLRAPDLVEMLARWVNGWQWMGGSRFIR